MTVISCCGFSLCLTSKRGEQMDADKKSFCEICHCWLPSEQLEQVRGFCLIETACILTTQHCDGPDHQSRAFSSEMQCYWDFLDDCVRMICADDGVQSPQAVGLPPPGSSHFTVAGSSGQ